MTLNVPDDKIHHKLNVNTAISSKIAHAVCVALRVRASKTKRHRALAKAGLQPGLKTSAGECVSNVRNAELE